MLKCCKSRIDSVPIVYLQLALIDTFLAYKKSPADTYRRGFLEKERKAYCVPPLRLDAKGIKSGLAMKGLAIILEASGTLQRNAPVSAFRQYRAVS